jgi:hypothetical protein
MEEKLVWFQKEYWYKSVLKTIGFAKTEIEAPLVLKHISYLSTLKNPIF